MPRYYFTVHDGRVVPDTDGTELPDVRAARIHAIHVAGEIVAHEAKHIALGEDWRLEVTTKGGLILFQVHFLMTDAPAVNEE